MAMCYAVQVRPNCHRKPMGKAHGDNHAREELELLCVTVVVVVKHKDIVC